MLDHNCVIPEEDLNLIRDVVREAGAIAKAAFDANNSKRWNKADSSPVTEADIAVNDFLLETLRAARPDYGWLSEETKDDHSRHACPRTFVVDPIDGTRAFIAGKPTFTTLIALCHEGRPLQGLISQAIKKERWLSSELDTEISECSELAEAMISTTSMGYFSANQTIAFQRLEKATRSTLLNHDGLAYGMLASGDLDIVLDARLKPYDFCALVPVVQQAGSIITDWNGREVTMQSDGTILAAANKTLHNAALKVLNSR